MRHMINTKTTILLYPHHHLTRNQLKIVPPPPPLTANLIHLSQNITPKNTLTLQHPLNPLYPHPHTRQPHLITRSNP
ncbi:hypothetical protein BC829DRAFT_398412 [Chytridium lagenaria]|nr:hypothetical protein BC829DRAFT_398412 [Chytridium lagenaria]